jgi:hypothetical protein
MFSVENRVGRLVESVLRSPLTETELEAFDRAGGVVVTAIRGQRAVCSDLTGIGVLSPSVSERLIEVLKRRHGGALARSAFLLPPRAIVTMQIDRIVRATGNPNRRTFQDRAQLIEWLSESLTSAECGRLREFLGVEA